MLRMLPWSAGVLLAFAVFSSSAYGATTRGMHLSDRTVVQGDDARALNWNPAGLGFLDGFDLQYAHTTVAGVHARSAGEGDGVFLAAKLLGPLRVGTAYQFLVPPGGGARDFRFTFGTALGIGRLFSFGLNVHRLTSDTDPTRDGLVSLDIGLMSRPLSWLAVGAAVGDLNTPRRGGGRVSRFYELGVAFRPGTDRVVLGLEGRLDQESLDADARFRVTLEPLAGMTVGAGIAVLPRDDAVHYRAESFLRLSLGYASATGGVFVGGRDEASFDGFSVGVGVASRHDRPLFRPGGQAVVLTLAGKLPERPPTGLLATPSPTFTEVVVALESLRFDPRVAAVVLELRGADLGWAQTEELRRVLRDLRAAGKTVVTHALSMNTRELLLASAGDHILLHPGGGVFLTGVQATRTYLRAALDMLGVNAEFVAIGAYKSYPEMFTRESASREAREARDAILDGLFAELIAGLAQGRGMDAANVEALLDGGPLVASAAVEAGLADDLAFEDELREKVEELAGRSLRMRRDYFDVRAQSDRWGALPHIAVVTIDGTITQGRSRTIPFVGVRMTGADTVRETLTALVEERSVRGILIRVNSPGGDALASERLHRAIQQAAKKKPLVVSFGDAAASGGYYAACGAPTIFTETSTLTGSIGIFAGKFVWGGLLERLGVGREVAARGREATLLSPDVPWTDEQRALVEARLGSLYDLFLSRVAEGRGLSDEVVRAAAEGRVWLGREAQARGLTDRIGGVREALQRLAEEAGLADLPAVEHYPRRGFLERMRSGAARPSVAAEEDYGLLAPVLTALVTRGGEAPGADLWAGLVPGGLLRAADFVLPLLGLADDGVPLALLPVQYDLF